MIARGTLAMSLDVERWTLDVEPAAGASKIHAQCHATPGAMRVLAPRPAVRFPLRPSQTRHEKRRIQYTEELRPRQRETGELLQPSRTGKSRRRADLETADLDPHRARKRAAQLRRQACARGGCEAARKLGCEGSGAGRDPVRRRARGVAGLHRRAAPRGSRGDAQHSLAPRT